MRRLLHPRGPLGLPFGALILLLLVSICCPAQRYSFREYTQGLGNLNIPSLTQDKTGFLWVGTQNGLYRYDGNQFQSYSEAQGMPDRTIQTLFLSPDGTLWVASSTNIFFEQKNGRFAQIDPGMTGGQFSPRSATMFASNKANEVVAVVKDGAILLRKTGEDHWVAERLHLDGGNIQSVLYGPDGALWYGCDSDLCRLFNGKMTRMRAALDLPAEEWTNLLQARNGQIWIRGALHTGEIDPRTLRFKLHDLPGAAVSEAYPTLAEDKQGRILTPQGSLLAMWEKDRWRMVTERNGLSRFEIQDLFVDRVGSVWISVVGHGLKRWVGQDRWEGYTAADGLSDDLVWAAIRDHKGRMWIGTESGLDWIPEGQTQPKPWRQDGIMTARAGGLAEGGDGAVWLGSAAGVLVRIDAQTLHGTQWKVPEIYNLQVDHQLNVWMATENGLYRFGSNWKHSVPTLVEDPVLGNARQRFSDVCVDTSGRIWATAEQGLFERDASGWHKIDLGSTGNYYDVIAIDKEGYVWAAGASQDLARLKVDGYRVSDVRHIGRPPLLSQQVVSLMVDHRGWLWVGQDAGLSVFDGNNWRSYTQDDGLLWNDTDSFALAEDADHSVWVGTSGGLSHLLTPQDAPTGAPQAPGFSQVMYGSKLLGNGSSVPWKSSSLEISMALLSFGSTQDAGIRYRLVGGQASEWEETRDLEVNYEHLSPGNYEFQVAEVDQMGHLISPTATYSFKITPRWWQRRDLQISLALIALAVLIMTWRRRMGALMKQKKHLEAAVKLRTSDLEKEKGELMRTREQMRHYAEHDDLTGLWNHRIIVERLRIEVDRSRREGLPVSVILADLDYFKRINDTYGHPAGDQVLKEASAIFQRMVRTYDWVGRYGGEEFLLILPGSGFVHARQRAEELRMAIQEACVKDGGTTIPLTASFGVASGFPSGHEELIREADEALYKAKGTGRNRVVAMEIDARRDAMPRVG
ncbi:MAG TPA: diguanylate cyclase [Terracidiphilus sp.]|nr:diguanylate cyclase [Terracidiphilus sp.]